MGEYAGDVGEYAGLVGEYAGEVGEYAGLVGLYAGLVGEYAGLVGEYPATHNTQRHLSVTHCNFCDYAALLLTHTRGAADPTSDMAAGD